MRIFARELRDNADQVNSERAPLEKMITASLDGKKYIDVGELRPEVVDALRARHFEVDLKTAFNEDETDAVQFFRISWKN